jgi:hypothetical protein
MSRKPVPDGSQWVIAELSPAQLPGGNDVVRSYVGPNGHVMDPKRALRFVTQKDAEDKINAG